MIRVEFPGDLTATLAEDGVWSVEGRQPLAGLMAGDLQSHFGPDWDAGAGYTPDPLRARAEAAAEAWHGEVVEDVAPEEEPQGDQPTVY